MNKVILMEILPPLALRATLHVYFYHLLEVSLPKCEGDGKDLQALATCRSLVVSLF